MGRPLLPMTKAGFIFSMIALLFWGIAHAYTFNSDVDPGSFWSKKGHEWKIVGKSKVNDAGMYFLVGKNPDPKHDIQYVLFEICFPENRTLWKYSYYKTMASGQRVLYVYRAFQGGKYKQTPAGAVDVENARQWLDTAGIYDKWEYHE